jgi:hypothetical protein
MGKIDIPAPEIVALDQVTLGLVEPRIAFVCTLRRFPM